MQETTKIWIIILGVFCGLLALIGFIVASNINGNVEELARQLIRNNAISYYESGQGDTSPVGGRVGLIDLQDTQNAILEYLELKPYKCELMQLRSTMVGVGDGAVAGGCLDIDDEIRPDMLCRFIDGKIMCK